MNKRIYETPLIDVLSFDNDDIITNSGDYGYEEAEASMGSFLEDIIYEK